MRVWGWGNPSVGCLCWGSLYAVPSWKFTTSISAAPFWNSGLWGYLWVGTRAKIAACFAPKKTMKAFRNDYWLVFLLLEILAQIIVRVTESPHSHQKQKQSKKFTFLFRSSDLLAFFSAQNPMEVLQAWQWWAMSIRKWGGLDFIKIRWCNRNWALTSPFLWVVKQLHSSMLSASSQDCLRFTSTKRRGKNWSCHTSQVDVRSDVSSIWVS